MKLLGTSEFIANLLMRSPETIRLYSDGSRAQAVNSNPRMSPKASSPRQCVSVTSNVPSPSPVRTGVPNWPASPPPTSSA